MRSLLGLLATCIAAIAPIGAMADDRHPAYLELTGRYFDLIRVVEGGSASGGAGTATQLGPLCIAYLRVKSYAKLFECVEKLQQRIADGDAAMKHAWWTVSPAKAAPLPALLKAEAYLDLGDLEKSIDQSRFALGLAAEGGYDNSAWPPVKYRLIILANLSVALALAGRESEAGEALQRLDAEPIPFAGRSNWLPFRKNGLARAYMATRQYAKVLEALEIGPLDALVLGLNDAASRTAWVGRDDSIKTAFELPRLFMVAKSRAELGDLKRAKTGFDALLAHGRIADFGDIHWLALHERARIAATEGDIESAIELWRRAVDLIESQRSSLTTEANKIGFAADKQAPYRALVGALFGRKRHDEAFEAAERARSRALVDMLARHRGLSAAASTPAAGALVEAIERSELAGLSLIAATGTRNAALEARRQLAQAAPELSSLVSVSAASAAEVRSRLPADEVLVQYHYDGTSLLAFVVTTRGLEGHRLDVGTLEADVRELREALSFPGARPFLPASQRLYDRLVRPIAARLGGGNVLFVAHGILHYLPFAALHDREGFLIERHAMRFLPSASVLRYLRERGREKDGGILALGNPDLGDPRLDLQFAELEAREVVKAVPRSRALVRGDASLKALRAHAGAYRYLHVASHGKFDSSDPLGSALLLSKDGDDDGLLTVAKLYSLRLDVDLVALSACETGLAKVAAGEELIGLTRGFLYAGASSIIASLWQVDDAATAALMTTFYARLALGGKREALRQAQLEVRRRHPHPFYWAAFQLTGSAR